MKKKILIIITLLMCFMGINKVDALRYYENVNISTAFTENVDPFSISEITVSISLPTEEEKIVTLTQKNNYQASLSEIPKGTIEFLYGIVDDDRLGNYPVTGSVIKYPDNSSLDVKIVVDKKISGTTKQIIFNEDQLNIIKGGRIEKDPIKDKKIEVLPDGTLRYVDLEVTTSKSTLKEETTSKSDVVEDDIDEDDGDYDVNLGETTTRIIRESYSRTTKEIITEDGKRNNVIEKVLLFVLIGVVLTLLLFASVKILRANK